MTYIMQNATDQAIGAKLIMVPESVYSLEQVYNDVAQMQNLNPRFENGTFLIDFLFGKNDALPGECGDAADKFFLQRCSIVYIGTLSTRLCIIMNEALLRGDIETIEAINRKVQKSPYMIGKPKFSTNIIDYLFSITRKFSISEVNLKASLDRLSTILKDDTDFELQHNFFEAKDHIEKKFSTYFPSALDTEVNQKKNEDLNNLYAEFIFHFFQINHKKLVPFTQSFSKENVELVEETCELIRKNFSDTINIKIIKNDSIKELIRYLQNPHNIIDIFNFSSDLIIKALVQTSNNKNNKAIICLAAILKHKTITNKNESVFINDESTEGKIVLTKEQKSKLEMVYQNVVNLTKENGKIENQDSLKTLITFWISPLVRQFNDKRLEELEKENSILKEEIATLKEQLASEAIDILPNITSLPEPTEMQFNPQKVEEHLSSVMDNIFTAQVKEEEEEEEEEEHLRRIKRPKVSTGADTMTTTTTTTTTTSSSAMQEMSTAQEEEEEEVEVKEEVKEEVGVEEEQGKRFYHFNLHSGDCAKELFGGEEFKKEKEPTTSTQNDAEVAMQLQREEYGVFSHSTSNATSFWPQTTNNNGSNSVFDTSPQNNNK